MNEIREKFSELRQPAAGTDFYGDLLLRSGAVAGRIAPGTLRKADNVLYSAKGRRAQPGYDITMKFSGSDY